MRPQVLDQKPARCEAHGGIVVSVKIIRSERTRDLRQPVIVATPLGRLPGSFTDVNLIAGMLIAKLADALRTGVVC